MGVSQLAQQTAHFKICFGPATAITLPTHCNSAKAAAGLRRLGADRTARSVEVDRVLIGWFLLMARINALSASLPRGRQPARRGASLPPCRRLI
jgi:hypothetical protein